MGGILAIGGITSLGYFLYMRCCQSTNSNAPESRSETNEENTTRRTATRTRSSENQSLVAHDPDKTKKEPQYGSIKPETNEEKLNMLDGYDLTSIPPLFICPITKEIMNEPVIISGGISYEKSALELNLTLNKGEARHPTENNKKLKNELIDGKFIPNLALKEMIEQYVTDQIKNPPKQISEQAIDDIDSSSRVNHSYQLTKSNLFQAAEVSVSDKQSDEIENAERKESSYQLSSVSINSNVNSGA